MGRTQFTFYESFYKALSRIRKGADRAKAYDAIVLFALYGEEPDVDSLPESVAIAYELVRPTLEASRKKSEAGRRGGSSTDGSKAEAKQKQAASKPQSNRKQEKEQDIEQDKEQMLSTPPPNVGGVESAPARKQTAQRFVPPTVREVEAYCLEAGLRIDAQRFVDFYASKGWRVGSASMKDWKAAARNWAKRDQERQGRPARNGSQVSEIFEDDDWAVIQAAARGEAR